MRIVSEKLVAAEKLAMPFPKRSQSTFSALTSLAETNYCVTCLLFSFYNPRGDRRNYSFNPQKRTIVTLVLGMLYVL